LKDYKKTCAIYRVFCCFDSGNLVVLFNGFHKKTQKTPKKEIHLASKLKEEYFLKKETKMKRLEMLKTLMSY
jgi:phage-related protein